MFLGPLKSPLLMNFYSKSARNLCLSPPFSNETRLELTLAIIKPHICKDPTSVQEIRSLMLKHNFLFIHSKCKQLSNKEAEAFYQEHYGRFFYDRLVSMMTSGECWLHVLAQYDAIKRWRSLMGPTKVFKTRLEQPDTIRGKFGVTDTRNATHGSDSPQTAQREIEFFFKENNEFSYDQWFKSEESKLRTIIKNHHENLSKFLILDKEKWKHKIIIESKEWNCK